MVFPASKDPHPKNFLILDLTRAKEGFQNLLGDLVTSFDRDMIELIQNFDSLKPFFEKIEEEYLAGKIPLPWLIPQSQVKLLSPIPRPPTFRDAYAFRQHVQTSRRNRGLEMIPEFDEFPVFYFSNPGSFTGPGAVTVPTHALEKLDFELEIAAIVGKKSKDLSLRDADEAIFGYCILNDWSARATQMKEMKLNLGPAKGKDFATSMGPWLVSKQELDPFLKKTPQGNRYALSMKAFHNQTQVSEGNFGDIHFTFAEILARVSQGVTLHPGDVIGSGTVGTGCFLELNGTHQTSTWLNPGDQLTLEVQALGQLENTLHT